MHLREARTLSSIACSIHAATETGALPCLQANCRIRRLSAKLYALHRIQISKNVSDHRYHSHDLNIPADAIACTPDDSFSLFSQPFGSAA